MRLTKAKRSNMPAKEFAGGGPKGKKGFPMNDKTHDRLAISGATRSYDAGNISKSKEESIKSEARHKLGEGGHPQSHEAFMGMNHGGKYDHSVSRKKSEY